VSRLRGLLALALLAGLVAPLPTTAASCARQRFGDWTVVRRPEFPGADTAEAPPQNIVSWAVVPARPRTVYLTNGRQLLRSDDQACTWRLVYDLPTVPGSAGGPSRAVHEITKVVVPPDPRTPDAVVLLVNGAGNVNNAPMVLRSDDGGTSWQQAGGFIPGRAAQLRFARGDASVAYLAVNGFRLGTVALATAVYRSSDGGRTWRAGNGSPEQPFATTATGTLPAFVDLEVDPVAPSVVWGVGGGRVFRSTDAARSWRFLQFQDFQAGQLDLSQRADEPPRVVVFSLAGRQAAISTDGGARFRDYRLPDTVVDAVSSPTTGDLFLTSPTTAYGFDRTRNRWVDIRSRVPGVLAEPAVALGGRPQLVGRTVDSLQFYLRTEAVRPDDPESLFEVDLVPPDLPALAPPRLDPAALALDLAPGQRRTVTYRLALPPTPTPVDLFFVIDTTSSMTEVIRGVQGGMVRIVRGLAQARVDLQVGVAEFKDYPPPMGDSPPGEVPYRRLRAVGPIDTELEDAIGALTADGGGAVLAEAFTTGLHQAVTGEGQDVLPPGPSPGDVAPGQDARWRPGAVRLVVAATDHTWHKEPGYPGPTLEQAIASLRLHRTAQIGLFAGLDPAEADGLQAVARATGAVVPAGGADTTDLRAGDPLVCRVFSTGGGAGVADAIVASVRALRDPSPVGLVVRSGGAVVASVSPPRIFDAKRPISGSWSVTYACPRDAALGSTTRVVVDALVRGATQVSASADVTCGAAAVPPPPAVPEEPVQPVAVLPPPALPPAPVQIPAAQQAPQGQSQQQAQNAAQGAVVPEEQKQAQLALVTESSVREEQTLAASRLPSSEDSDPALAWLAGVAALAAGAAVAHRRAPAEIWTGSRSSH
jgi:hypothetical protein